MNKESGTHVTFADLKVALKEAFDTAIRQLQDYNSKKNQTYSSDPEFDL